MRILPPSSRLAKLETVPFPRRITRSGEWTSVNQASATQLLTNGRETCFPIVIDQDRTLVEMGVMVVTTAGGTGSLFRFGVRADDSVPGYPGALLLDAGTAATTATGYQSVTGLTLPMRANRTYWISGTQQGNPTPAASVGCIANPDYCLSYNATPTNTTFVGYGQSSQTGALGAFTLAGTLFSTTVARILLKWA